MGLCTPRLVSYVRESFSYYLFKYFPRTFLFLYSFLDPCNANVGVFDLSPRSLKLSSFLFIFFFFLYAMAVISTTLVFQLAGLFFCLMYSAVDSFYYIFLFRYCLLQFCLLFFIFSNSSLKTSYNFLLCTSILFLSSLIIFTIITLNSFLGRLPISTSLGCSSVVLSCSFIWNIFLCCFILFKFLFLF